jgi:hypothetical protein
MERERERVSREARWRERSIEVKDERGATKTLAEGDR